MSNVITSQAGRFMKVVDRGIGCEIYWLPNSGVLQFWTVGPNDKVEALVSLDAAERTETASALRLLADSLDGREEAEVKT